MLGKITRILFKSIGMLLFLLVLLVLGLYFAVQSHSFQTWLGKKAASYLSEELHTSIRIEQIEINFFSKAHLKGVYVADQQKDTLLSGDVLVDISGFNVKKRRLSLDRITLSRVSAKLVKHRGDSAFNYQFLSDYFSSAEKDTSASDPWDVKFGSLVLDDVSFMYRDENADTSFSRNMNFDNLSFSHTSGKISNFRMEEDEIHANIHRLSTKEHCGFTLNHLTTKIRISSKELSLRRLYIKTPGTLLKGEINFTYSKWEDFSDFLNKVKMESELQNSHVSFSDIAVFASELNGLNETILLSGKIKGYVSDLRLSDFNLQYGRHTRFNGNLTLTGLPDFSTSFLHFDAKEISTSYADLRMLPAYPFTENKKLDIPYQVKTLGVITFKGKFDGFVNDFTAYGRFNTALGSANTDVSVKLGKKADDIQYRGQLKTERFNIGALFNAPDLKELSINTEIKGKGLSLDGMDTKLDGHILNVQYNHYDYKNIILDGSIRHKIYSGMLMSKDENADFDFDGKIDFNKKIPEMDFIATINRIDFKKLNFSKEEATLSSQALIILKGDNINNLTGTINFDNTIFTNAQKTFTFSTFDLRLQQETADKTIHLTTSYFNADVDGRFNITTIPTAFNHFLHAYYPAFVTKIKTKNPLSDAFKFSIKVKKFKPVAELLGKDLMISANTVMGGDFDVKNNLFNINLQSDSIRYGSITFFKDVVESYSKNNKINIVFKASEIHISDSLRLYNYFSYFVSQDKDTKFNFEWNNKTVPNNAGRIFGKLNFSNELVTFNFDKFFITAKDSTWNLVSSNAVVIDSGGKVIVNPLVFSNKEQMISVNGVLSNEPQDSLVLNTRALRLQQFNPLLGGLKLDGEMNGYVSLHNLKAMAVSSDLLFNGFKINNNALGQVVLVSKYNSHDKHIFLDGYSSMGIPNFDGSIAKNISFRGFYYMDKREEPIDIDFGANPANLKLLNPFLEGILTIKNAMVSGKGRIHGSPADLKIDGALKLYQSEIKVDYTNVTYNITGLIEIMPDQIRFSDLLMKEKGLKAAPQGTINGNIFHKNFSSIQLDYDVTYRNMLVLNTSEKENKTFYGKMYGTGNVGIWGYLNKLHMQVIDTTEKNSKFILPLDGPAEVEESNFIHFVKKDTIKKAEEHVSGFDLQMFMNVTPDVQTQIILDKRTGDILNVQGLGDLRLMISTLGKFEMVGDYYMTGGDYRFTLENVINKKFDIDAGSSISWSGDPLGAELNVVTSYRQRASIAPLLNDTTGKYKTRVAADCKLKIAGKLFSPAIRFGIDFPSIDATDKAKIDNLLSDEAELNRQVFSFLLFRSFVTPAIYNVNSGGVTAGGAAASTGSEMLSNQVSSFLNSYVGNITGLSDLNLGLNYRPGSQSNSEAVDLALSKQLFNNKLSVEGNFGVNNNRGSGNSSGIIDVNIEYKLTEDGRYRLKGFNRSNDNVQRTINGGGPFTQGAGLFYREEFETFNDLFKRYLEKLKKNNAPPKDN